MFNREKSTPGEKQSSNSATLVSEGTTISGDIVSDNDLRIDGIIKGNISCSAKIIIGPTGTVDGDIEGVQADINGNVHGNISIREILQLRGDCKVTGNINASKLQIDPTATFNGQCQMGPIANIVQMSADVQPIAEAK